MSNNTKTIDFKTLVLRADKDHFKKRKSYEFSNGRKFESSDKAGA